ncbi:MAG: hypothetical protein AAB521_00445 [Patescibacteria group bacterium]
MKSKISSSEAITKEYLKKRLARLATKDELGSLGRGIDFKLEGFKEEIDENAKKYRDQILTKLDGVMSELETRRDERDLETHQYSELKDQVDDHEGRIKTLEQIQPAS